MRKVGTHAQESIHVTRPGVDIPASGKEREDYIVIVGAIVQVPVTQHARVPSRNHLAEPLTKCAR